MTAERRRAGLTLAAITGGLAFLCGWLLLDSLTTLRAAMTGGAPVIRVDGGDAAMIVLVPLLAAFAILGLIGAIGAQTPGRRTMRAGAIVIGVAVVALPVALAAPWAFGRWAADDLTARGYARCVGAIRPTRLPAAVFARPAAACPTEGG